MRMKSVSMAARIRMQREVKNGHYESQPPGGDSQRRRPSTATTLYLTIPNYSKHADSISTRRPRTEFFLLYLLNPLSYKAIQQGTQSLLALLGELLQFAMEGVVNVNSFHNRFSSQPYI